MTLLMPEVIKKKREGKAHSHEEIDFLVRGVVDGSIPDYQLSAWLMTVYFQSLSLEETTYLTQKMTHSGKVFDLSSVPGVKVDKHSTGGVGDKTSLIIAPLVAAAGLPVPMIAGRGLGHTGGTVDKLEAIPGYQTQISPDEFQNLLRTVGTAVVGQSPEVCPADKKLYALRDVTATVESIPLICASIMSKKLASGLDALVLDVKFGSGAFMKDFIQAKKLLESLIDLGRAAGKTMSGFVTEMNQPLGRWVGNAVEVRECMAIMKRDTNYQDYFDTESLSVELAASMLVMGGVAKTFDEALLKCRILLDNGKAFEKFEELCRAQKGNLSLLPQPAARKIVLAPHSGFLTQYQVEGLGYAAILLRAGRTKATDIIDPTAGIYFFKKLGDTVTVGEPLFELFANQDDRLEVVAERLLASTQIGPRWTENTPLIAWKQIGAAHVAT